MVIVKKMLQNLGRSMNFLSLKLIVHREGIIAQKT